MADVQSTATLTINVTGQDQIKGLADSLNEMKSSAGEVGSSIGELGPQIGRTRAEMNDFITAQRDARWAAQDTAGAQDAVAASTDAVSAATHKSFGTLREYAQEHARAQKDVTAAERGFGDLAEAQERLAQATTGWEVAR